MTEVNRIDQKEREKRNAPAVLICGFPGVGKSTLVSSPDNYTLLDSDSSSFSWSNRAKRERNADWPQNYLNNINANRFGADGILISSHKEVRDALVKAGMKFALVYPSLAMRDEYLGRYIARGNDPQFVELLKANYDTWIRELMVQEGCDHVVLQPGQYLSDVISSIVKSSQPLENNTLSLNVFV
jgi:adenylate kinase family enzyme